MAERGRDQADNLISKVSQLADNHLTLVRNISTGLAVAGVLLFARSIRLTSKFTSAKDIPLEFIKKNVKLRGKLLSITGDTLEVEHVPISLPIVAAFQSKWTASTLPDAVVSAPEQRRFST
uniref:Chromosome 3 open reading frame 33 n=1 Tax=Xenopus tropicalis TaxID=8364 RepID=F6Z7C8_XENTR